MKKIIILLTAVIATFFISCKSFDSKPIEPHIIGTAYLNYDAKSGLCYAEIDSIQYTVPEVTILNNNLKGGKTQQMPAVDGMQVTIYTSPYRTGIQAVVGEQTEEQIEELNKTNTGLGISLCILLGMCVIVVSIAGCFSHKK